MVPPAGLEPNELLRFVQLKAVWNQATTGICHDSMARLEQGFEAVRTEQTAYNSAHAGGSGRQLSGEGERCERPLHS